MSKEDLEKKAMVSLLNIASAWYDQMKAGEFAVYETLACEMY